MSSPLRYSEWLKASPGGRNVRKDASTPRRRGKAEQASALASALVLAHEPPTQEDVTQAAADPAAVLLPVAEAARRLGMSKSGLYRAIERGEIPATHIGRRVLVSARVVAMHVLAAEGGAS